MLKTIHESDIEVNALTIRDSLHYEIIMGNNEDYLLGFCKSISLKEIEKHGWNLSLGSYVGVEVDVETCSRSKWNKNRSWMM